jgi:hypothetical protein
VSRKSWGIFNNISKKSVMLDILFYPKFSRVGNKSPSGLKILLEVTSVKWKVCNIYCWPQCILRRIILLFMLQVPVSRRGLDCMENSIITLFAQ